MHPFMCVDNLGRLLVGLRWWSEVQDDGSNKWVFESKPVAAPHNLIILITKITLITLRTLSTLTILITPPLCPSFSCCLLPPQKPQTVSGLNNIIRAYPVSRTT